MNAVHCLVLGLAIAIEGSASAQQTSNPQLPQNMYARVALTPAASDAIPTAPSEFHLETTSTGVGVVAPPERARTADTKFFLLNGIHLGMAVFDVEMTQNCIAEHSCREANPVLPSSRTGQLSVDLALVAYTAGVSYWLKKHNSKLWWLLPSSGAAIHGIGVSTGFDHQ
jgi:hypothetical protein